MSELSQKMRESSIATWILALCDEIESLESRLKIEYERGVIDGKTTQAMLELKGQDRFLQTVPKDIQVAHKEITRLNCILENLLLGTRKLKS